MDGADRGDKDCDAGGSGANMIGGHARVDGGGLGIRVLKGGSKGGRDGAVTGFGGAGGGVATDVRRVVAGTTEVLQQGARWGGGVAVRMREMVVMGYRCLVLLGFSMPQRWVQRLWQPLVLLSWRWGLKG